MDRRRKHLERRVPDIGVKFPFSTAFTRYNTPKAGKTYGLRRYNSAMHTVLLCSALSLILAPFASASTDLSGGAEKIPKLMADSTLVCKGEVIVAPALVFSAKAPSLHWTATAFIHTDRCFKGETPLSETVPVLFDNILPSGGTSGGTPYVILRKGDYRLYFLKPEADKYILVDRWSGQLEISRRVAEASTQDPDPMHQLEMDLKAGLTDPDRDLMMDSIRMLGNMRHLQSKAELIPFLDSPDALVRTKAYQAMLRLHDYSVLPAVEKWLVAQPVPPDAVLLPRDSLFHMQYDLVGEIAAIRDPAYLPTMERMLHLPKLIMRRNILDGIRAMHSPQSVPIFLDMLNDPDLGFVAMQGLFDLGGDGPIDWVPSFDEFRDNRAYYATTCSK
jgi:hypothetical protein